MGAPNIGGDLSASITEGDINVTGDLDNVGAGNNNAFSITAQGTYGVATINTATGEWSYALDNSDPDVIALGPGDTLTDTFSVRLVANTTLGQGADTDFVSIEIDGIICYLAGTLIDTPEGKRPVETLRPGDEVMTLDGPAQPIRWAGQRSVTRAERRRNPKLHPVRITAGSLGNGLPARDLIVSRQHRMLMRSAVAERMFGAREVLVPAIKLTAFAGIFIDESLDDVTYVHLLLDNHEVIIAEGAASESLYTGPQALLALGQEARDEIMTLFPELACPEHDPTPARPLLKGPKLKALLARQGGSRALCEA